MTLPDRVQPSRPELRAQPEALARLLADLCRWRRDVAYEAEFVDGLGGGHAAHLFGCPSCHAPKVRWDED